MDFARGLYMPMMAIPYPHQRQSFDNPASNAFTSDSIPPAHLSHLRNLNSSSVGSQPLTPNPLQFLRFDEQAIRTRKLNIARFGAGWLRPPGVSKTLQGRAEEQAERAEAEAVRLRELAAAEEAEAEAEAEMMRNMGEEGEADGEGGEVEEEGERDLDEDVPDADVEEEGGGEWDSDEEDEEEDGDNDEDEEEDDDDDDDDDIPVAPLSSRHHGLATPVRPTAPPPPYTPTPDRDRDRTPQRFRVNPFQPSQAGEGDGDYAPDNLPTMGHSSPLAPGRRGIGRAAGHIPSVPTYRDVSPGLMAAINRSQAARTTGANSQYQNRTQPEGAILHPQQDQASRPRRSNVQTPRTGAGMGRDLSSHPAAAAAHSFDQEMDVEMSTELDMDMDMSADMSAQIQDRDRSGLFLFSSDNHEVDQHQHGDDEDGVVEGSYEHTDTEIEDVSSFLEYQRNSSQNQSQNQNQNQRHSHHHVHQQQTGPLASRGAANAVTPSSGTPVTAGVVEGSIFALGSTAAATTGTAPAIDTSTPIHANNNNNNSSSVAAAAAPALIRRGVESMTRATRSTNTANTMRSATTAPVLDAPVISAGISTNTSIGASRRGGGGGGSGTGTGERITTRSAASGRGSNRSRGR